MIVLILYQYSFAKYVPGLVPLSLSLFLWEEKLHESASYDLSGNLLLAHRSP